MARKETRNTMTLFGESAKMEILERFQEVVEELEALEREDKIETINEMKKMLHQHSPFKEEPVDCVLWVKSDTVNPNDYNPNAVAPPEMRLLEHSIKMDGYTQPVVTHREGGSYVVVDGAHRTRVGKESSVVAKRTGGYVPITEIKDGRGDTNNRMAATIRHNRARGRHGVKPMVDIVADMILNGWDDTCVAQELGMDADELLRLKQTSGLPELFEDHEFSRAWE